MRIISYICIGIRIIRYNNINKNSIIMKQINYIRQIIAMLALAALPGSVMAHMFVDNGIYYSLNGDGSTVRVTFSGATYNEKSDEYEGKITIPSEVTYDGQKYSVTEIGASAFRDCSKVTSVSIPETVVRIGPNAFMNCKSITSMTIPNSVTSIGESAFQNCQKMEFVSLSNAITLIDNSLFNGCSQLASITIPSDVREIGASAFQSCSRLESITLPTAVEIVGRDAFAYCSILEQITLQGQVEKFNEYVFNGTNPSRVVVPSIDTWARIKFAHSDSNPLARGAHLYVGSKEVTDMTIPQGITRIENYAFRGFKWLKSVKFDPSVKEIGYSAFEGCTALASLDIPNGVEVIEGNAFYGCTGMKTLTLANSITSIGDNAFRSCTALASVALPDGLTSINPHAFRECSGLVSVEIPNSITSIGGYAFDGCGSLKTLSIPNSVTTIGDNAFSSCSSLKTLSIPNSVTTIGGSAFSGCTSVTKVSLGNSLKTIGGSAFSGCTALTSVEVPSIEAWCQINFYSDNSNPLYYAHRLYINGAEVTNLVIPETVYELNKYTFVNCTGLSSVTLPSTILKVPHMTFSGCSNLKTAKLPNSITVIDVYAFQGCEQLTSFTIPSSVKKMGDGIFKNCSRLKEVAIGSSVTEVGYYAFQGCERLETVKCLGKNPPSCYIYGGIFEGVRLDLCTLIVPTGYRDAYAGANVWKDFGTIEEEIFDEEDTDLERFDNVLYVEPATALSGTTTSLSLMMNNAIEIVGFQCDFYAPEGTTVPTDAYGIHQIDLSTERTTYNKTNLFETGTQPDGSIRILCGSSNNSPFSGKSGEVATINLILPNDMAEGEHPLVIRNIVLSDANGKTHSVSCIRTTLTIEKTKLGDANGDGFVNIGDYTSIANKIMGKEQDNFVKSAADANGDGSIDVGDLAAVVKIIMSGTAPAAARPKANAARRATDVSDMENVIYAPDSEVGLDGSAVLSVKMKNNISSPGFQFDLEIPEGFEVPVDENGIYQIELSTERTTPRYTNFFATGKQEDGSIRVLCSSTKSIPFEGNDGEVCKVTLRAIGDTPDGGYTVVMKNIVITDCDGNTFKTDQTTSTVCLDMETGIADIKTTDSMEGCIIHTTDGQLHSRLQKGINIVTYPNGVTKTILAR